MSLQERGYATVKATIPSGQSLSGEIHLGGYALAAIIMPAGWDAADLTFQGAAQSQGAFQDVYDDVGNEVTVTAAAGRAIGVDVAAGALAALRFLKLRSGTSGTPVNQAAERTLTLVLKA